MKLKPLTIDEAKVILDKGTEPPFTGEYDDFWEEGTFVCRQCETPLYESVHKFDAQCGWPSFDKEIPGKVRRLADIDGLRTEIQCVTCGAHLGHVFTGEHFTQTNTRHCVNSISLKFVPQIKQDSKPEGLYDIPFVPSSGEKLAIILDLAGDVANLKTVDLGAGDGRIVIAMAKNGAKAFGYEIDPKRAKLAMEKIKEANLDGQATIYPRSFWEADLSRYDVITIYGITGVMARLQEKLAKEARSGSRIISNTFTFPDWEPVVSKDGVHGYLFSSRRE